MPDQIDGSKVTVSLPDGSTRVLEKGTTTLDLAASIGKKLAADAVAAKVNGDETDLTAPLDDGASVEIISAGT